MSRALPSGLALPSISMFNIEVGSARSRSIEPGLRYAGTHSPWLHTGVGSAQSEVPLQAGVHTPYGPQTGVGPEHSSLDVQAGATHVPVSSHTRPAWQLYIPSSAKAAHCAMVLQHETGLCFAHDPKGSRKQSLRVDSASYDSHALHSTLLLRH